MTRIFTNNRSVFTHTLAIIFFIFVSQITSETATQSDLILQEASLNYKESNSSLRTETTTIRNVDLHFLDSTNNSQKAGICNSNYFCKNGGICAEEPEKLCECKPGTSGRYCEIVDECVQNPKKCGNDLDAQCVYDLKEEKAMCNCKNPYKLFDMKNFMCREKCLYEFSCYNGAKCMNNLCECLPGTSGDRCTIVDACSTHAKTLKECGKPDNVYCEYNITTQDHFCQCRIIDYFYDPYDMRCKECDCGPHGNCSFVKGNKTCHCEDGYVVSDFEFDPILGMRSKCKDCRCGSQSNGCAFTTYFSKECYCNEGYAHDHRHEICSKCDCGLRGNCHFDYDRKVCDCREQYEDNDGTCEECYCGPYGDCSFKQGNKTCACQSGSAVDYDDWLFPGICKKCYCYMNQEEMNCTFSSGVKHCICPTGYEQLYDNCVDINECLELNACPRDTICDNTPGSYECHCKQGYKPYREGEVKKYGCQDINECLESNPCPFTDTTDCLNIPGSYWCECKIGYVPQSNINPKEMGCWEDQSSWQVGYIFLLVLFILISLGLIVGICKRYRNM